MIQAAFYSVGCFFEGSQQALGSAWFVMYPSIVGFVLMYASLFNMLGKIFRRRMSDWVFPYIIAALSIMHYARQKVSGSSLLNTGGRMSTLIESLEFEQLTVLDMLLPDIALRMGGNVPIVLQLKLFIFSLALLPLCFSEIMSLQSKRSKAYKSCGAEKALNIRACNIGGIGCSIIHKYTSDGQTRTQMSSAYELTRLGYLVLGDRYVMKIEDWLTLTSTSYLKIVYSLWNYRLVTFRLIELANNVDDTRLSN